MPYGVKVKIKYYDDTWKLHAIYTNGVGYATRDIGYTIETFFEDCTPYLFPLSSMSEEQKEELMNICGERIGFNSGTFISFNGYGEVPIECVNDVIDWLNANHFDYLGLIEKGLAINATNLNIY